MMIYFDVEKDRHVYPELISVESIEAIIEYIDEGEPSIEVIRAELGEIVLRHKGEYIE